MKEKPRNILIATIGIILTLIISLTVFWLLNVTGTGESSRAEASVETEAEQEEVMSDTSEDHEASLSQQDSTVDSGENALNYADVSLEEALGSFNFNHPERFADIRKVAMNTYGDNPLQHQAEIMQVLEDKNLMYYNFGFAFLPDNPAQYTEIADSGQQLDVPLQLQSDPRWMRDAYGDEGEKMRQAGCALVSLAMVHSYLEESEVLASDVLEWSGMDYWMEMEGTSWQIFQDYADDHHWHVTNHADDFYSAMDAIPKGEVVIASVNPGHITPVGHILVIRGYDPVNELVYINDPNDDPKNMYSLQGLPEYIFLEDAINFWSFGK
ncbi:hypothetical protein CL176_06180 [Suicoccus acidiformans]|uniref:Peptidase C39-like domain-containing protein n=1 Tax=Suicoccus acidiformans TaxID=2036206 RepID=A0A347WKK9_9LACT|nr:C39 family peptidase [Suicoccus acidiformans]AXY25616.1 hypothetical protein CL176_06180 [Suicoccus acidiformans]